MKPTKPLQIGSLIFAAAIVCGCQRQEDRSGQEAVRLLQDIKTAVSATHRNGEAFVVLKSDAVIYMADMQVLGFKPDFNQHFAKWKQEWSEAYQTHLRDLEAKNPDLENKLKELDDKIADTVLKTNTVNQAASEAVAVLVRRLESEKDTLLAEQAKFGEAYEEYQKIANPFDERLGKLNRELESIQSRQKKLAADTIDKVNRHIVSNRLTVPTLKLTTPELLFAVIKVSSYSKDRNKRPNTYSLKYPYSPFHVDSEINDDKEYTWFFLENVPADLEGTPLNLEVIKSGYINFKILDVESRDAQRAIQTETIAKFTALIPWVNRHSLNSRQSLVLVSNHQESVTKTQRIIERIVSLKGGGKEAKDLADAEVQQRLQKLTDEVGALRDQRKQLLEDATKTASLELKLKFRASFFKLAREQASFSVQTGSKGDFSVPADIAYLYAERHRENGETLVWLLRVDPKSLDIRMSNSNTTTADGAYDQFWMLGWNLE